MMYVGRQKENPKRRQFFIGLFILLLVCLLLSSILDKSPSRMMADAWNYMIGATPEEWKSYKQMKKDNLAKDSIILELESAINMMKKSRNYRQAIVSVESESLNMRAKPVLGAEVLIQLPLGSIVEVLYFDDETLRIGGEYGKWCKVSYAGKEGWVWGNYIKLLE